MMSSEFPSMLSSDFASLKERHERLYDKISEFDSSSTQECKNDYTKEIKNLVIILKKFSSRTDINYEQSEWIRQVALRWDVILSSITEEEVRVRSDIEKILPERNNLIPSKSELNFSKDYLEKSAYYLGLARKLRLIEELRSYLDQATIDNPYETLEFLYRSMSTSNLKEEMNWDWYSACTYFSRKILVGTIALPTQVKPDVFYCLEDVWLEDVKRLEAYDIWHKKTLQCKSDHSSLDTFYFMACENITASLTHPELKSFPYQLDLFKEYLNTTKNYLDSDGKLHRNRGYELIGESRNLVARKAYQLWDRTRRTCERENWISAERYVENFYENIVPAVKNGCPESIKKVTKVIRCGLEPNHKYIINCFEAALVIYFIRVEDLEDVRF